jgi:hypothetical protein
MQDLQHEPEPHRKLSSLDVAKEADAHPSEAGSPFLVESFGSSRTAYEVSELTGRADCGRAADRGGLAHGSRTYHGSREFCTIGKIRRFARYVPEREEIGAVAMWNPIGKI